jgi:hypothetical protein
LCGAWACTHAPTTQADAITTPQIVQFRRMARPPPWVEFTSLGSVIGRSGRTGLVNFEDWPRVADWRSAEGRGLSGLPTSAVETRPLQWCV